MLHGHSDIGLVSHRGNKKNPKETLMDWFIFNKNFF